MKTILLVVAACWILYKSGTVKRFLNGLQIDSKQAPTPPPENRAKWENETRYILAKQGLINPDTVKYMGDEMLIHIVRDYLDI